jgi:DNA-binding NarL/FixJ family response regulator
VLLIFNVYKSKKLDQKKNAINKELLEKDLELKKKELTIAVMGQLKQNRSLHHFEDELKKIESISSQKLKPKIQRIIRELEHDKGPVIWKEFETRFTNIHAEFYAVLKKHAPDLTPSEIKVCSFLKLGLNTKEISELLYKSPSSIEVDRARIRKKLGLTSSKTNLTRHIQDLT